MSNLFTPKGKGQSVVLEKMSALVVGLSALVLALAACAPVPVGGFVALAPPPVEAVKSEVVLEHEVTYGSASLAANPELMLARRYTAMPMAATLAANPELIVARRYAAAVQPGAEAATLASNPELSSARYYVSYAIDNEVASTSFLAANPELMIARRYAGSAVTGTDAAFLAANPELMIARR